MAQYNNPYYLATGDGGVESATIVPDFTSIPNSDNFLINSNLGDVLNFRQSLNLKDNFLENYVREEYPKASSYSREYSSVEFEFSAPGYIHCKDIMMNWRMNFVQKSTWTAQYYQNMYHTPFALLNLLDYYEIKMGNNNFIVGRPEFTNDLMAIKTYLTTKSSTEEELISRALLGDPASLFCKVNSSGEQLPDWNIYARAEFQNQWRTVSAISNPPQGYFLDIPVALSWLAPFFNQDAYLPPHLKINIKMFFKFSTELTSQNVLTNANFSGDLPSFTQIVTFNSAPVTDSFFVVYNYKIIKETYTRTLNAMLMEKDLLYNYFNMRTFRKQCDEGVFTYDIPIAWSKQRPQELFFTIEYGDLSAPDPCYFFGTNPIINSAQGYCGGFYIQLLEVYANGQMISRFRNRDFATNTNFASNVITHAPVLSCYDVIQNLNISRMSKQSINDTSYLTSDSILINQIVPLRIVLDPSLDYNENMRSLDKGTTNTRIRITLVPMKRFVNDPTNWLANWTKYSLVFRFKEAAQIAIDHQLNVQEIDWPCVRANSKKYLNATLSSTNSN